MEEYFSKFTQKGLPGGPNELKAFTEGFIVSSEGQWAYPGMNTLIPNANGRITMQGVDQPVLGIDDLGNEMLMQPGEEYQFPGDSVYEIPMKKGGLVKMPKLTKKNKKSYDKKFSKSINATSRLFTESDLFAKPKSKKNKIFDPNSRYQDGGEENCEDGRCLETDQAQELLDKADALRYRNVDTMWDVAGQANPENGQPKDAAAIWKSKGVKTLESRLGVSNPSNCMWAAGSGYQCLPETKGKMPLVPFESNDKFLNAVSNKKIPFRKVTVSQDPNFATSENNILRTGDIINMKGPNTSHALTFSHYREDGMPIFLDSNGEASDFSWNQGLIPGMVPGTKGIKAHVSRLDPEMLYAKDLKALEEKARTNPTYYEDGGVIEAELSDEEIEEYKKGGWIVEDLDEYATGGGGMTMPAYEEQLRQLENSIKAGYKGGKWYPHNSVEGGTKTIGYGHKLSGSENYSKGLTTAQVLALQKKDIARHTNIAKSTIDKKYGAGTFDKLPESRKVLLVDYAYNGVLHKFPSFMDATVKGDKNKMLKEYMRYTNGKPLTQRNAWTKSVIEGSVNASKPINTPKKLPAKPVAKAVAKQPAKKPIPKPAGPKPTFSVNETFSYDKRPGAVYKVADNGDWFINLGKQTQNNFVPMNDPTGERQAILKKYAHINEAPLEDILQRINNSGSYDIREDLGYLPR
jgi:hypothetical protein